MSPLCFSGHKLEAHAGTYYSGTPILGDRRAMRAQSQVPSEDSAKRWHYRIGRSPAQCKRFVRRPGYRYRRSAIISGAKNPRQVEDNVEASAPRLAKEESIRIADTLAARAGWYNGYGWS